MIPDEYRLTSIDVIIGLRETSSWLMKLALVVVRKRHVHLDGPTGMLKVKPLEALLEVEVQPHAARCLCLYLYTRAEGLYPGNRVAAIPGPQALHKAVHPQECSPAGCRDDDTA